jgi:hypothetical protein
MDGAGATGSYSDFDIADGYVVFYCGLLVEKICREG